MSLEGQGGAADPVGFGVPVMVEGKWDSPKIYPDMAGILDNPSAAYSKLNQLGVGLFGNGKADGDSLMKGFGNLFKDSGNKDDKGIGNKDDKAPVADDKKNQQPSAQSQPSKPQETQAPDKKPPTTQADDDDPKDTRAKIKDILKDLFGK